MSIETQRPPVSVVVPVHNEAGNVAPLAREIAAALAGRDFEIVFVDDASKDQTKEELIQLKKDMPQLRVLQHTTNAGQSRAVRTGVLAARHGVVATLDGDGQNDPADLPRLIDHLTREDAPERLGMVQGKRKKRRDTIGKRVSSKVANAVRKRILDDGAEDSGCGIKAFYRDAFLALPYFDHMHRYMAALMKREGYESEFLPVEHRERQQGRSKYTNLGRLWAALSDLWGVLWLRGRSRRTGAVREL